jgi:hypothetical protein
VTLPAFRRVLSVLSRRSVVSAGVSLALAVALVGMSPPTAYSKGHAAAGAASPNGHGPKSPRLLYKKGDRGHTHAQQSGPNFDGTTDMTYHGGPVMRDVTNYLIFWNPTTPPTGYTGAMFDGNYRSIINRYFNDIGGTPYLNIISQYGDSSGLPVPNTTSLGGDWVDTTTYPHAGTNADPLNDGDIRASIDRAITANPTWQGPSNSTMYFVFTGKSIIECDGTGSTRSCFSAVDWNGGAKDHAAFCAYHWNNGSKIYGFIPYASTGSCFSDDTVWPNGVGVDVSLDVTSHEQFEAYTDPFGNAWQDDVDHGAGENGDKCNFNYGPYETDGTNMVLNGHPYQIQLEWSNGSPHGCVKRYGARPNTTISGNLNFGAVPRGESATREIALQNTGNGDLDVLDVKLATGSNAAFSLSPTAPTHVTLHTGDTALYDVTVSPSASASSSGPLTATLAFDTDDTVPNDTGQPTTAQLTATTNVAATATIGLPALTVTGSLNFGTVPRGTLASRNVVIQNTGTADLHITDVSLTGGSDPAYSISPPSPAASTLAPSDSLTVEVTFAPPANATGPGPRTGSLSITTDAPSGGSASVPATGTVGIPKVALSPGSINFGVVCPGGSSDQELTVTNTGTAPLTIITIAIGSGSTDGLSILPIPGLPQTLPVGGHLAFTVRFTPVGPLGGPVAGTVVVTTDDPVNPEVTVPITGEVGQSALTVSTTALDFGGVATDNRTSPSSRTKSLTLSNTGNCSLSVATFTIGGSASGDYSIVGGPTLPLTIGAGSSVTINVRFNPTAAGPRNGTLTVASSDPSNPSVVVNLTGVGLIPAILTSPLSLTYGPTVIQSQAPGYPGVTQPVVVTNTGQSELIVDVLGTSGAPFSAPGPATPPSRFAASDHFSEPVTFAPTAVGKFVGSLTVADNDPEGGASATVPLCGEGVRRGIRVLAVNAAGVPFATIKSLKLQSKGTAQNVNVNVSNLSLTGVPTSCDASQQKQYENQALPATDTLNQRASYYTLSVTAGGKSTTVTFTLGVSEFKTITVTIK